VQALVAAADSLTEQLARCSDAARSDEEEGDRLLRESVACFVPEDMLVLRELNYLDDRFIAHFIKCNTNLRLQNAISKYGLELFVFHILEFVPEDMLVLREQYYLDILFTTFSETLI